MKLRSIWLGWQLGRIPWTVWLAVTLAGASLAVWTWQIPRQQARVDRLMAQVRAPLTQPDTTSTDAALPAWLPPLRAFEHRLGRSEQLGESLRTIYSIAGTHRLELDKGEYAWRGQESEIFARYEIALPVEGSDAAVRRFAEDVLVALPYAALEEVQFKRTGISAARIEARLRFTLYVAPAGRAAAASGGDR